MVKLVSSREARRYAPPPYHELLETVCSAVYVLGAILLLAGLVFQLPSYNSKLGLVLLLLGSLFILYADVHDLYAHLAGIDFRMDLFRMDLQYMLVEFAVPLVSAAGSFLILLGALFLLLSSGGRFSMPARHSSLVVHALRLLIAGPALWLLASIHNAFQLYERANFGIQLYERSVTICFIIGSTLLLSGSVLGYSNWPSRVSRKAQVQSTWYAIAGSGFLVLGGIVNLLRVGYLQRIEDIGGHAQSESLRGGAQEALRRMRGGAAAEPFVEGSAKERQDVDVEGAEAAARPLYKDVVTTTPERLY